MGRLHEGKDCCMFEELAGKKYMVIYADPPWSYNDKMSGHSFSLEHEYKTQSKDWIGSMPVSSISAENSCLFLWVTSPHLPTGLEVMRQWGFDYKTVAFCWSKKTKNWKDVSNLGRWTMGNIELCLLGTRGSPNKFRIDKSVKQLVKSERKKHSEKPSEVRDRIVQLFGDVSRIELFARDTCEGWDSWGDEITKTACASPGA